MSEKSAFGQNNVSFSLGAHLPLWSNSLLINLNYEILHFLKANVSSSVLPLTSDKDQLAW